MKLNQFIRYWKLQSDESTALHGAVVSLTVAVLALRLLGLKRTLELLGRAPHGRGREDNSPQILANETRAVARAARATGMGTCLSKSLALCLRLRRRGIDTRLRIGVRKGDGGLSAHAWLEYEGRAIDGQHGVAGSYLAFPPIEVEPVP